MSEQEDTDIEIGEETISTDSNTVIVTDSEDYGRTQKLKHIYKAKESVQNMRRNQEKLVKEYNDYWTNVHGRDVYHRELAKAVAEYGSELLPVIEEAVEKGQLDVLDLQSEKFDMDVRDFVATDGREFDKESGEVEPYSIMKTLDVHRCLNSLLKELGLGLRLEEEKGPAQI